MLWVSWLGRKYDRKGGLFRKILVLSLFINVLLSLSLAPTFGSIGVAISAALSLLFWNVALYKFILKEFNLNPSIFYILNTQKYE